MRPPTKDAISRAVQLLLESIDEENGARLSPGLIMPDPNTNTIKAVLSTLSTARETILHDFDHRIAAARKLLNTRHPLVGLPAELTRNILQLGLDRGDNDEKSLIPQLQAFAGVSVWWWREIVSSPEFWRKIDLGDGCTAAAMALRKSGGGALDVRCDGWRGYPAGYEALAEDIGNQVHRWRSVVIHGNRLITQLLPCLRNPTPHLHSLNLKVSGDPSPDFDIGWTDWTSSPPLRSLSLYGLHIPLTPTILTGLRSLSITFLNCRWNLPEPIKVAQALVSCPQLEALSLDDYRAMDDLPFQPPDFTATILLPRLQSFFIQMAHHESIIFILRHIVAPSLYNLRVELEGYWLWAHAPEVLASVTKSRGEFAPPAELVFQNLGTSRLAVEFNENARVLQIISIHTNSTGQFRISLPSQIRRSHPDVEQWRPSCAGISLPITAMPNDYQGALDPLRFIPSLATVEVRGGDWQLEPLLEFFSHSAFEAQDHNTPNVEIVYYPSIYRMLEKTAPGIKRTFLDFPPIGRTFPKLLLKDASGHIFNPTNY